MLKNLRVRLTLLYSGFSFLFVLIIGAGLYFFLVQYFQTTTDRALEYRLVQQLEFLGLPVPKDLAEVRFVWLGDTGDQHESFQIFTPLPAIKPNPERTPFPQGEENDEQGSDDDENNEIQSTPAPTLTGEEGYGSTGYQGESGEVLHDYDGELSSIFFMQVDPQGKLIESGQNVKPPISPAIGKDKPQTPGSYSLGTVRDASGREYRLLTFVLPAGAPAGYFQFGRPVADQSRLMREFLMGLLILGGISLVLMAWGSWVVAGRSIRPVQLAVERQQEFVANASHELRTPLTLIRGTAELASLGTHEKEAKTALKEIIQDTDYMSGMVDDLLMLSRIDSGVLKFNREGIALDTLLEEMREKATRMLTEKHVQVDARSEAVQAMADGQRLRQVLWILIDNAARHTPESGLIRLMARVDGDHAAITVQDNGSGIEAEHLERVFDRFYQAPGSSSGQNGAGLGLSLAKALVEGMGGKIGIKSATGEGTTVEIRLERA